LGEHCIGRNLAQRGLKRKIRIPKIKYGVPGIPEFPESRVIGFEKVNFNRLFNNRKGE